MVYSGGDTVNNLGWNDGSFHGDSPRSHTPQGVWSQRAVGHGSGGDVGQAQLAAMVGLPAGIEAAGGAGIVSGRSR